MAKLSVRAGNENEIEKKPKVYFTCHPDDFEKYFDSLCEDILDTQDCAIYYTEDMREIISAEDRDFELGRSGLLVVPVTLKLLTEANRAMDEDIPYARENHIPILPVMMESGLDVIYSRPDKLGELQYLNPDSGDETEIAYSEKLKKHLESVLISNELATRVRKAFDAYVFLSYRKKDRRYANELMRMIHSDPECYDIAIWFDEFLTPGESFKQGIEKMLEESKLFALLITPCILEKVVDESGNEVDNYVVSTEIPLAHKKGAEIFAVEMKKTDEEQLKKINIGARIRHLDDPDFKKDLVSAVKKATVAANNTAEHDFLIGLAYLDGIDVEVNKSIGAGLITSAAESGFPEAMKKLYNMFAEGIGVQLDYNKALYYGDKYAEHIINELGEEHSDSIDILNDLAVIANSAGLYKEAVERNLRVLEIKKRIYGEEDHEVLRTLNNLSVCYSNMGETARSMEIIEHVCDIEMRNNGEDNQSTLIALSNLAVVCNEMGDYKRGLEINRRVYAKTAAIFGKKHEKTFISLTNLASSYSDVGDYKKALKLFKECYDREKQLFGERNPHTITTLNCIAVIYGELGQNEKARKLSEETYALRREILGEDHPDTILSLNNLAVVYDDIGEIDRSFEMKQQVFEKRKRILGADHYKTLEALINLASSYYSKGELEKAAELFREAYKKYMAIFDENHPSVLLTLNNLAVVYADLGNHEMALNINKRVYTIKCDTLGSEHPDTLISLSNIAMSYRYCGDLQSAFTLIEKSYELRCKVLGEEHPDTMDSLQEYAAIFIETGDYKKALELFERLNALQKKVYGKDHKKTKEILGVILKLREILGT